MNSSLGALLHIEMKVFSENRALADELRKCDAVTGFVPTMGALHQGHIALVERARAECDTVVVSIFVNPTQFNDPTDLKNYPRSVEADLELLSQAGADYVYVPSVEEIYPEPDTRVFEFGKLDKVMEGALRPGHFNGVAQVVSRLFDIVKPTKAYFGEKDFQQLTIIQTLVEGIQDGPQIIGVPIVRAEDGLALSSRNALLSAEHRQAAPTIYAALKQAAQQTAHRSVGEVEQLVEQLVNANPYLEVEYFQVVDAHSLQPISQWGPSARGCIAVRAGAIRLIDNIDLGSR